MMAKLDVIAELARQAAGIPSGPTSPYSSEDQLFLAGYDNAVRTADYFQQAVLLMQSTCLRLPDPKQCRNDTDKFFDKAVYVKTKAQVDHLAAQEAIAKRANAIDQRGLKELFDKKRDPISDSGNAEMAASEFNRWTGKLLATTDTQVEKRQREYEFSTWAGWILYPLGLLLGLAARISKPKGKESEDELVEA
jgi:hypothetical protein